MQARVTGRLPRPRHGILQKHRINPDAIATHLIRVWHEVPDNGLVLDSDGDRPTNAHSSGGSSGGRETERFRGKATFRGADGHADAPATLNVLRQLGGLLDKELAFVTDN